MGGGGGFLSIIMNIARPGLTLSNVIIIIYLENALSIDLRNPINIEDNSYFLRKPEIKM